MVRTQPEARRCIGRPTRITRQMCAIAKGPDIIRLAPSSDIARLGTTREFPNALGWNSVAVGMPAMVSAAAVKRFGHRRIWNVPPTSGCAGLGMARVVHHTNVDKAAIRGL
jgi:hypothetical protein